MTDAQVALEQKLKQIEKLVSQDTFIGQASGIDSASESIVRIYEMIKQQLHADLVKLAKQVIDYSRSPNYPVAFLILFL